MFKTDRNAELLSGLSHSPNGVQFWSFIEQDVAWPWFYLQIVEDDGQEAYRSMLMVPTTPLLEQIVEAKTDNAWLEQAQLVTPAHINVTAPQTTPSSEVKAHRCCAPDFPGAQPMMRPDPKVKAVYLYPKPVDFRKSINGLAALVELDIKVAVFDPALFVFLNRTRNQVKILYWHRNGFCLWLKRLEAERFKTKPDAGDEAIELTVRELNQLLEGIDLWGNQPHKVLTPRFVT